MLANLLVCFWLWCLCILCLKECWHDFFQTLETNTPQPNAGKQPTFHYSPFNCLSVVLSLDKGVYPEFFYVVLCHIKQAGFWLLLLLLFLHLMSLDSVLKCQHCVAVILVPPFFAELSILYGIAVQFLVLPNLFVHNVCL